MKGIILAGGSGTRLYPITKAVCKQLLPIYDKPMIYYPLSVFMLAGIHEILVIANPSDIPKFQDLLQDGKQLGIAIQYAPQPQPNGIAEAFLIGEKFINNQSVALILGDNIFYGQGLTEMLQQAATVQFGATIFGYYVNNPQRYGVVFFDTNGKATNIVEKPSDTRSKYAVVGLYFYDRQVVEFAKTLVPSKRGELEITDINNLYLRQGNLNVKIMGRGFAWLDTGTFESFVDATSFIKTIEDRQGLKIACIEEIAYRNNWITKSQLEQLALPQAKSGYGQYLLNILNDDI